jgi:hypothetical protein
MPDDTFRWAITGAVAISTLCILIMAIAAIALYRVVSKVQVRVGEVVDQVSPLLVKVRRIADDNSANVTAVVSNAVVVAVNARDISEVAKEQAHRFAELGRDFADRAKAQIARVDAAVDKTVDQVQVAGETAKVAVLKPVKEVSGIIAGVKAAVSSLKSNGRRPTIDHITQDEEMFI